MKYNFSDLVDISKLQELMEAFYATVRIPSAVMDTDGNILVAIQWREICTNYHRVNPETELMCKQSDKYIEAYINENLNSAEPYIWYKCANGLIDAATPIIIDGVHVATLFCGQLLFDKPDIEKFRLQAKKYGFNELKYLSALAKVPIISEEELKSIMGYFRQLAYMLAEMGLAKLKLMEANAKSLIKSEERLRTIIANTPNIAIQSYDRHGRILFWNNASEKIFGWTFKETVGKTVDQLMLDKEATDDFNKALKFCDENNLPFDPKEWKVTTKDGTEKIMYSTIFPIYYEGDTKEFICMDIDITERKTFEMEIARLDRLNLIGEIAASIGHEVRNPLTTVRGFLQILSKKDDCVKYQQHFNLMIEELDRANVIITEFLSLSKNKLIELEMKSINSVIKSLAPLIYADTIASKQNLKLELGEIPDILIDEKEIRQLILNLARNGIEAMSTGGYLTIKTYKTDNEVSLSVEDQGKGIEPHLMSELGKPFFTTKSNGTGLGLAVCHSIASRHNAEIKFESGPEGTKVMVKFKI